jgi:predicted nucleic acid-binding protein
LKTFVLDASTALGWLLDRPVLAKADHTRKLILSGAIPVVPVLWRHEVSNAVVIAERRGRLTPEKVKTLTQDLDDFSETVEVDQAMVRISVLIETARRTHLTVYDAAYVELAGRRGLPLATLDDALAEAARRDGVSLV